MRQSESDEEYDDEDDEDMDDEEIEMLINADYEDGTKGQTILDPDDLADIIRVDSSRLDLGQGT